MKLGLDMRLLVLGLCGCFVLVLGHTNTQNCNMQLLASQVSAQLHATFESNLHAAKLQKLYQNVEFSNAPSTNPHDILQAIARGIEHKLNETINALLNAKTAVTNTGASNTRIIECCAMPAIARANYSYRFRAMLNTSVACKTRNPKDSGIIQGENSLVNTFRNNLVDSSVISWQYFGTSTGNYLQFPASGKVCNGSSSFDPRFQSWYVEAVTRMRTNIVVVIDRSSSMSTAGRMALARQAAVTVLDTLGPNDKVGVVAFSHFIIKPPGCFGGNVAEALPKNINRIKAWVEALTPRGATKYVPALEAAFEMLGGVSHSNSRRSAENMILFLTDGDPFDRNPDVSIFEAIRIGQRKLAFPARINVYGLGESLNIDNLNRLKQIASLNNGTFTQINDQDASSLSTIMGKYYTSTAKTREDSPAISVPHLIKDLGLVVTLSLAVKSRHGNVSGVVAVDAPLDTLMKEVVHFSTTGLPYAIVVDNKGRTLLHPNAPAPTDHLTAPTFQPLTLYEPFLTPDMYRNITSGTPGSERIQTSILLSRGDPLTDGVTKVVINATYTWQPVRGGVYTIILVTSNRMDARFLEKATGLLSTVHSYYHRLDLSWQNTALSRTPSVCRTDGNLIAPLSSTVKIAPEAFNDSARYVNTPETQHDVEAIERFFNDLSQQVKYSDLSEHARVDVLLTAQLENQWNESRHRDPDTVKWRYIGTEGGVFRVFPGLRMNKTYSHKRQPWYRRAIANAGRLTVSRASLGKHLRHHGNAMISVGKTFTSKRSDWMVTEPVAGVTGLDMTIDAFREMLDYTRERCAIDSQDCYIMDDSGFLVIDIRARSLVVSRHVTGVFPWLAVKLTSVAGLVEPQWCNNLEDLRSQLYYTIHLPLNSSKSAPDAEPCRQFSLDLVPHTNVFLLSVTSRDGLVCNESPDPSCRCQVACTSCTGQVNPCQCPCSCKMKYDECTNSITGLWTGTPCPAPLPPLFDTAVGRQLKLEALRAVAPCPKPCYTLTTESDCNTSTSCHWCSSAATPKCSPVCRTNKRLTLKVLYPCNDFLYLTPSQQGEVLQAFRDILYRNITKLTAKGLGTTTLTSEGITLTLYGTTAGTPVELSRDQIYDLVDKKELRIGPTVSVQRSYSPAKYKDYTNVNVELLAQNNIDMKSLNDSQKKELFNNLQDSINGLLGNSPASCLWHTDIKQDTILFSLTNHGDTSSYPIKTTIALLRNFVAKQQLRLFVPARGGSKWVTVQNITFNATFDYICHPPNTTQQPPATTTRMKTDAPGVPEKPSDNSILTHPSPDHSRPTPHDPIATKGLAPRDIFIVVITALGGTAMCPLILFFAYRRRRRKRLAPSPSPEVDEDLPSDVSRITDIEFDISEAKESKVSSVTGKDATARRESRVIEQPVWSSQSLQDNTLSSLDNTMEQRDVQTNLDSNYPGKYRRKNVWKIKVLAAARLEENARRKNKQTSEITSSTRNEQLESETLSKHNPKIDKSQQFQDSLQAHYTRHQQSLTVDPMGDDNDQQLSSPRHAQRSRKVSTELNNDTGQQMLQIKHAPSTTVTPHRILKYSDDGFNQSQFTKDVPRNVFRETDFAMTTFRPHGKRRQSLNEMQREPPRRPVRHSSQMASGVFVAETGMKRSSLTDHKKYRDIEKPKEAWGQQRRASLLTKKPSALDF